MLLVKQYREAKEASGECRMVSLLIDMAYEMSRIFVLGMISRECKFEEDSYAFPLLLLPSCRFQKRVRDQQIHNALLRSACFLQRQSVLGEVHIMPDSSHWLWIVSLGTGPTADECHGLLRLVCRNEQEYDL